MKTSTKIVAGASAAALALAFGPVAYAGPLATEGGDEPVLASILVELDLPSDSSGPLVFFVEDVPVTDGVELHAGEGDPEAVDNPSSWCGGAYVDIAADLSTVTLGGGDDYCNFEEAYFEIELNGAEWEPVVLESDNIFEELESEEEPEETSSPSPSPEPSPTVTITAEAAFITGGHMSITPSRLFFAAPPAPQLDAFGVDGSLFAAYWLGEENSNMAGTAVFSFGAPGAEPVEGEADFAG